MERSVSKASVLDLGGYYYSGVAMKPTMTVRLNDVTLVQDLDYRLTYTSNTKAGTAKVTIRGIGDYTGVLTKTFIIHPGSITGVTL